MRSRQKVAAAGRGCRWWCRRGGQRAVRLWPLKAPSAPCFSSLAQPEGPSPMWYGSARSTRPSQQRIGRSRAAQGGTGRDSIKQRSGCSTASMICEPRAGDGRVPSASVPSRRREKLLCPPRGAQSGVAGSLKRPHSPRHLRSLEVWKSTYAVVRCTAYMQPYSGTVLAGRGGRITVMRGDAGALLASGKRGRSCVHLRALRSRSIRPRTSCGITDARCDCDDGSLDSPRRASVI